MDWEMPATIGAIAGGIVAVIGICGLINMNSNATALAMVRAGADPIAARCATAVTVNTLCTIYVAKRGQ